MMLRHLDHLSSDTAKQPNAEARERDTLPRTFSKGSARMTLHRLLPFVIMLLPLLSTGPANAQPANPPAGDYIYEGGAGSLRIKSDGHFDISTIGANAHSCALEGTIVRGKAKLEHGDCVVSFSFKGGNVEVGNNGSQACRENCGMRASFAGTYIKPTPACTAKAVATARRTFKRQYDTKDYVAAQATLAPVLGDCDKTIDWITKGWILNDLALAQLRGGDRTACLKTLQPLAEGADKTDDGIKGSYPPADAEVFLPVVRAARTNLKLCRG
ncbi:hypothetical protein [Variovorax paradoxus]|uniref:hypothetical protein n=1 Tax=Variovorax paradoxus TaxID=34073 RepID=UPI003D654112